MQITRLFKKFDSLQKIYGDKNLDAIYGGGNINNPKVCLVFMNPTARNVSADKKWSGIKAPWIGTKNIWNMFCQLGLFSQDIIYEINAKKPNDWDYKFAEDVYKKVCDNSIYITNLSKATQVDARALPDDVFRKYIDLLKEEIDSIKPKIIITFGNQVSSILLNKKITVSGYRKKYELFDINGISYKVFPVYYPVGQGMRNIKIAKEDISWIIKNQ
ncbi:MAG: phage SPO1 DNA polymerase-related protein [Parcubacteria group bacterium GW2011_GWA2_36_10]|nr:MAG: phage SPO1 DNA polymerase-related protein [Parcubacteria group bacterium GW2011_GWA2_36_10]